MHAFIAGACGKVTGGKNRSGGVGDFKNGKSHRFKKPGGDFGDSRSGTVVFDEEPEEKLFIRRNDFS